MLFKLIRYIGRLYGTCGSCKTTKYHHIYIDDKATVKGLFPEVDWEEQRLCEVCAKRETGSKSRNWNKIKRSISND